MPVFFFFFLSSFFLSPSTLKMGISTSKICVCFVPSWNNKLKQKSEKISIGIKDQHPPAEMISRKLHYGQVFLSISTYNF